MTADSAVPPTTDSERPMHDADAHPDAERLARLFHETYERLAPRFDYETRKASAVPWDDVPGRNKALMVAVADNVIRSFVAAEVAAARADERERCAQAIEATLVVPELVGSFTVAFNEGASAAVRVVRGGSQP